jgi:hypothetical protein
LRFIAARLFREVEMSLEHAPQRIRRLRRVEACAYLKEVHDINRSPKTLAKEAVIGGGPHMIYENRIPTYTLPALDAYAERLLSPPVRSTAERRVALKARAQRDG